MRDVTVTLDFHNTIINSDAWFQIEVFDLPGAWLRWHAAARNTEADPELIVEANAAYRRLRQAIHEHGHELTAEACLEIVLPQVGVSASDVDIIEGTEAIMFETMAGISPVDGVIDLIRDLEAADVRLGIVSSAVYHDFLLWSLDRYGITDAFDGIATSASVGWYKSRPEIYWNALDELGATPDRALHLGDSARFDVATGRRAGMQTVWYQRPGAKPLDDDPGPDLTLQSLVGSAPLILDRLSDLR
ncbi:MAG: HAD family hydrolase [Thermomicrobiales bacterium]|nr:HAD family hydrolase [Thermomicrobiales bacterium]